MATLQSAFCCFNAINRNLAFLTCTFMLSPLQRGNTANCKFLLPLQAVLHKTLFFAHCKIYFKNELNTKKFNNKFHNNCDPNQKRKNNRKTEFL